MKLIKSLCFGLLVVPLMNSAEPQPEGAIKVPRKTPRHQWVQMARISAIEAIQLASAEVPGVVLALKLEVDDGVLIYDVKIVGPDDHVIELELDAGTGGVLDREEDNDG